MRIQLAFGIGHSCIQKTNEPIYVELFNEKELSAFIQHRPEEVYQSADFYQLVWSKLLPFTDGYTDVYFSR